MPSCRLRCQSIVSREVCCLSMSAYWLTYKPLTASSPRGWPIEKLKELVLNFDADPVHTTPLWRIISHRTAKIGDRFYLFKQGADPRGIFGVGNLIEDPRFQPDPADIDGGPQWRARIRFTRLVDPDRSFLLDLQAFLDFVPNTLLVAQASGNSVPDEIESELERRIASITNLLPPLTSEMADDPSFDPDSITDERERALRTIRVRRGQAVFRAEILEAYDRRCAITGCAVEDVLEAAHITPYLNSLTNHVSNGLLLRSDLHTLFDCQLITIEPNTRKIVTSPRLEKSSYFSLSGKPLRSPKNPAAGPSKRNLEKRYAEFIALLR